MLKRFYYILIHGLYANPLISGWAHLCEGSSSELPGTYTWTDKFFLRAEYLERKSFGEDVTFDDVEYEYLKKWDKALKDLGL